MKGLFRNIQDSIFMQVPKCSLQKSEMEKYFKLGFKYDVSNTVYDKQYMIYRILTLIVSKIDSRSLPVERGQDQLYYQQG